MNRKTMTATKQLGIWMDHSHANIIEQTSQPVKPKTIESKFTHEEKEQSLSKSENIMHNKEKQQHTAYYKKLSDVIKNYDEVVLFGPTTAKNELANLLKNDHQFEKVHVVVKHADKMTEHEQHTFMQEHFSR